MFKKTLIALAIAGILSSCAGYQFGDITKRIIQLERDYCAEENALERALILASIHLIDPAWVPVCVIVEVITE